MELKHLNIIVTGAASGLGAHFTRRLLEAGASVAAGDLDEAGLRLLASNAMNTPGNLHTKVLDVAQDPSITNFIAWAHDTMGGLNGLINNAGIIRDGLLVKCDRETGEVTTLSRESWDAVIGVNLTGATMMVQHTVADMASQRTQGVIVNLSSVARHGNRGQSNYVAAKAALAANTVTWAREFSQLGIRVGSVAPGMVETPMTRDMHASARERIVGRIPVGRIGVPEDIWLAVRFIIECDYFNGRTLDVDGGLQM